MLIQSFLFTCHIVLLHDYLWIFSNNVNADYQEIVHILSCLKQQEHLYSVGIRLSRLVLVMLSNFYLQDHMGINAVSFPSSVCLFCGEESSFSRPVY